MSSNSTESRPRRQALSISTRLTLLYTLTSFVAVAIFTGVLYWMLAANFRADHLRFLRGKAGELLADFREGGAPALLAEITTETSNGASAEYQARVLDPRGLTLGETQGMSASLSPAAFPPPGRPGKIDIESLRDRRLGSRHFVLATLEIRPAEASAGTYTVELALDVSRDDALLAAYRDGLLVFLVLLIPVLLAAGHIVTRRGLAPLQRISQAARAVTPVRLTDRIPLDPPWPAELSELVDVLNGMMARLEEAFGRLSQFSADLAHELRTPLNNLMGEMEVCITRERDSGEYRRTLTSGLEECRRLTALIENLLFIARAEEANRTLGLIQFEARDVCNQVLGSHANGANARDVHLVCEGSAQLLADPILFRQALGNLLSNAVRHAPARSDVYVTVRTLDSGAVEIGVADGGDGIPPEHLNNVFERFYQVDSARTSRGQGTGLGLSIVRSIMKLHGGTASLESRPGRGTLAKLYFPNDPTGPR